MLLMLCALFFFSHLPQPSKCLTNQAVFHKLEQKYLANHVIETKQAGSEFECGMYCVGEESCASVNYKMSGIGKGLCELNSETLQEAFDGIEETNPEYNHLVIVRKNAKLKNGWSKESERKKEYFNSCKNLLKKYQNSTNGNYTLYTTASNEYYDVYCHMTNIPSCGGGGWTLVAKIDGDKNTFIYNSPLWTNNETYAIQDGLEGLTEKESKLASYWNTPFTKICLGMTYNGDRRWMTFDFTASSLYSVIADGQFREITAGRATWKSLIAVSSLQSYCNKEGFNMPSAFGIRLRLGIVANEYNDCHSCNSWIAYGVNYNLKTCGNHANHNPDNGVKSIATFGYILVQ